MEVLDLQAKVDALVKDVAARRAAATGDQATKLQALETRLGAAGGGGGRGGGRGGGAQIAPIRTRLNSLFNQFTMSGAQTGSLAPPTGVQRADLAAVKKDLAAIELELVKK